MLRLPASLSKPSWLYLGLFLLQLFVTLAWLGSLQRERHNDAAFGEQPLFPGMRLSARNKMQIMLGEQTRIAKDRATVTTGDAADDAGCESRVSSALALLQSVRDEMHGGPVAPSSAIATTPSAVLAASPLLPYLIIGIPSAPRKTDYLSPVLAALERQLESDPAHPLHQRVHVWVMNNAAAGQTHNSFEANAKRYADRAEFRFLTNDGSIPDPLKGAMDSGNDNTPGWRVRKQTRDIVSLMNRVADASAYYLVMEDDFELCPHTMDVVLHSLTKANRANQNWIAIKMGYGFNGVVMRNNEDLKEFARYLLEGQARRPPDHLMTEWLCGEKPASAAYVRDRPQLTHRYNLFKHLGTVSSLRDHPQGEYPRCYHVMDGDVVFLVEAFDALKCAHDDLSPCIDKDLPNWTPPYGLDAQLVAEAAFKLPFA